MITGNSQSLYTYWPEPPKHTSGKENGTGIPTKHYAVHFLRVHFSPSGSHNRLVEGSKKSYVKQDAYMDVDCSPSRPPIY